MSVFDTQKKLTKEDWHRADVVAALHKKGWSLRALSVQSGLSAGTLKSALDRPYLKAEEIIATAIGVSAKDIWPNRYQKRDFVPMMRLATKAAVSAQGAVLAGAA